MPPQVSLGAYANDQAIHQIQQLQARQQLVLQEMERQKAVQNMGPPIVNGSMNGALPVETNGLTRVPSEGQQAFPTFGDGWVNYDATNGHQSDRSDDISPTRSVPHSGAHQRTITAYLLWKLQMCSEHILKRSNLRQFHCYRLCSRRARLRLLPADLQILTSSSMVTIVTSRR